MEKINAVITGVGGYVPDYILTISGTFPDNSA